MSKKQWGHGFHTGEHQGMVSGLNKAGEMDKQMAIGEIDWIIENLSLFFVEPEALEPVAISRAITMCLYHKAKIEDSNCDTDK